MQYKLKKPSNMHILNVIVYIIIYIVVTVTIVMLLRWGVRSLVIWGWHKYKSVNPPTNVEMDKNASPPAK